MVPPKRAWRYVLFVSVALLAVGAVAAWLAAAPDPQERYRRGVEAYRSGDMSALESEASVLGETKGYEAHASLLRGMARLRRGRLREAVELFGRATEHPQTRVAAYTLAGEAFYKMRRLDDGRRALSEAVRLDPNDVNARRWLASTYYDLGLMTAALAHLRKLGELAPHDARPHRLAGLILKDFENYEDAVAAYRESLRRDPRQADADRVRAELAESLIRLLRYDEALAVLEPAPATPEILVLQAQIVHAHGDPEAARDLLARALERAPDHPRALSLLGGLELEAGRAAEAIELLRRAATAEPADYEIRHKLAQAFRHAGRDVEADEQTRRMLELRELRTRFTALHDQAMEAPQDAQVRYELGRVAIELGRPRLAAGWFEAALAIDPYHGDARDALAALASDGSADRRAAVPVGR